MDSNFLRKFLLTDRVAVITGGGGLLGRQHAMALLELQAIVVLTDISAGDLVLAKKEVESHQYAGQCFIEQMDVSSKESILRVSDKILREHGRVDILINNAAINPKVELSGGLTNSSRLENFDVSDWDQQVSVGLTGAILCSQIFGESILQNTNGGVILNISSDLSVISPDQRLYRQENVAEALQSVKPVSYSVIKSGLIGLTRYLSTYWADRQVRVNALSPGGVYNGQNEEFTKRLSRLIPLGRMANADEYRAAVQFLCSDASLYLNGQNIVMDGGRSVW
jgi:NAD(P)-dependent dehydrogenase (short-subunit alcohol dehydrogenase family)